MFKKLLTKIVGDSNKKLIDGLRSIVDEVGELEPQLQQMSDEQLRAKTAELRERCEAGETLEDLLVEAYALVREASVRTTGLRHYDVQIMGGILLHRGEVVEMRTGEGKTLVATLPLFLNALTGRGVHLVTVNEYLARRDGGWMGNIFYHLGLSVACIGPQQFSALYDPDYVNPGAELEDERLVHWRPCTRQQAYMADITYGISSEFGFDYLRDNMATSKDRIVQRELHYAVIDEVDNVLIDEARTPLIISGPAPRSGKDYVRFAEYVRRLKENTAEEDEDPTGHYDIDEKSRSVSLTEMGIAEIENRIPEIDQDAGDNLYDPRFFHLTYYLDNALRAQYLFKRDVDYVVQDGEVIIVDDFTGRLMPGRRYSDGLHEAIEAKEGVNVRRETVTVATITLQNYFRLYEKLAGMTGTALTDAEEFDEIYELGVAPLPTNVQDIVESGRLGLQEHKEKIEGADAISYINPETGQPVFFKRIDFADQVYATVEAKDGAIIREIKRVHEAGRPILVGTTSVEHSETIDRMLKAAGIPHSVLNAKMHQSEALVVAQAGRKQAVTISTNMAGRGTDILLGGNPEGLASEMIEKQLFDRRQLTQLAVQLFVEGEESARAYAQKHPKLDEALVDELQEVKIQFDEALAEIEKVQIIGFLARTLQEPYELDYDQILHVIRLVRGGMLGEARLYLDELNKNVALVDDIVRLQEEYGRYQTIHEDPTATAQFLAEMLFDRHYNARAAIIRAVLGNKDAEAQAIQTAVPGMPDDIIERIHEVMAMTKAEQKEVRQLGGLHVIGSERHESRRIDNQLRGRAARQGDPGSSRFFLSLEDDLMRRFGGERLKAWMSRGVLSSIPEDTPLEFSVLDRIIESSQERIEGYNFDIRKNVVEYDDVMNRQRQAIYNERRAILLGETIDLDDKIEDAFTTAVEELVNNYINNYISFIRGEIDRTINDFSTDALDTININGVVARLRGLLPAIVELDRAELADMQPNRLTEELLTLAYENEENGLNIQQLLQAMGRFLPLLATVPNLGSLASRRSGQVQARENARRDYLAHVEEFYNDFLAQQIDPGERTKIWQDAEEKLNQAFGQFNVDGLSVKNAASRQLRFRLAVDAAVRDLLLTSLSTLDSEQLVAALRGYVQTQQDKWRARIGEEEYQNFQRLLLLDSIDREWRDYLTAMDDLRREVGLEAVGQRDPKVQYKIRSAEMFADMRHNIDRDVVDRFFRQVASHQAYVKQQEAEVTYQLKAQEAGYQVVKREQGKGVELRRDVPKVGRNDPCPCGSGKKYKHCHGSKGATAVPAGGQAAGKKRPSRR
ncbi:MAG: SEC-C domain-containing protein [Ardenticatenaceae bacterium]|nr:SEC-C domain-containing protein [Ardenticatenaceae bacterium]MCB8988573.1 SEC-C domain-containing protein [Ardenticatenaceae bacterium]